MSEPSLELDEPEASPTTEEPAAETSTPWWAWLLLIVLIGWLSFLAYRLYPAHHRGPANPNFIDNIFANNLVLFAARLVLIAAALVLAAMAVFVVMSVWKRGKAGHWLTRFGPLETQAVQDLRGEVDTWQNYWFEASQEADQLRERLEASDGLIAQLHEELEEANRTNERLQQQGAGET